MRRLALALVLAITVSACGDDTTTSSTVRSTEPPATFAVTTQAVDSPDTVDTTEAAPWPTAGWATSTAEQQGMDSEVLADLIEHIDSSGADIDSVTIVRNGYLIVDAVFRPFAAGTPHIIHSVTKSVVSTLIGIAIDEGLLAGVETSLVEVLSNDAPAEIDERKAAITVEDVLTMSSGLDCRDSYLYRWRGLNEMRRSADWTAHVLALPMAHDPGTYFEYCNGGSFMLSAILSEVTGGPALAFAEEALFGPLGITEVLWPTGSDEINIGWGEIRMIPADLAKFGYLYLREGVWDGEQIVPADWVAAATSAHIEAGTLAAQYGYQWWVPNEDYYMALGYAGQYVTVVPDEDLVVVFTGGLPDEQFFLPQNLLHSHVLEAIVGDEPLAANSGGEKRLAAAVAAAAGAPAPAGA